MGKTNINSSVEEKVEAIIRLIKKEFPDMTSEKQAAILAGIVGIEIAT